jgi:hypothetical protein
MILFNTLKKASHYVKYKNSVVAKDPYYKIYNEHYKYFFISKDLVIESFGWRCGCGCGQNSNDNIVIGRIKAGF